MRKNTAYQGIILGQYTQKAWDLMTHEERVRVLEVIEEPHGRSVCSMCSGSGTGEIAHHAVLKMLGRQSDVWHTCESAPAKRQHLIDVVHPRVCTGSTCVFTKLEALAQWVGDCMVHNGSFL